MTQNLPIHVVLVEDHGIVRTAIKRALSSLPWINVVGEAEDGVAALTVVERLRPEMVILDIMLPKMGGVDVIHSLKRRNPDLLIVVLTGVCDGGIRREALRAGADGYVLKSGGWPELESSISHVLTGHRHTGSLSKRSLVLGSKCAVGIAHNAQPLSLTPRERQVLKLLAEGHSNQGVAAVLNISVKTVDRHRENLINKTQARTPIALAVVAFREGLIEPVCGVSTNEAH